MPLATKIDSVRVHGKLESLEKKIEGLETQMERLNLKLDKTEQYTRRNSVRIYGIKATEGEFVRGLVNGILTQLCLSHDGHFLCFRLSPDVIFVDFESHALKEAVLRRKHFLRKSLSTTKIIIVNDLTHDRRAVLHAAQKAKKRGLLDRVCVSRNGLVVVTRNSTESFAVTTKGQLDAVLKGGRDDEGGCDGDDEEEEEETWADAVNETREKEEDGEGEECDSEVD